MSHFMHSPLAGKHIVLCVTGSIAAYKAVQFARLCLKAGASVQPVMTKAAMEFVGPTTFSGICGKPVLHQMWDGGVTSGEVHVDVAAKADIVAIVPATADVLARLAHGRADDMVTAISLCTRAPMVLAPAMHPRMWESAATQRNVELLRADPRITFAGPTTGVVASGDDGMGRMLEPEEIFACLERHLLSGDFAGVQMLVTAGPTQEAIDPVRYLGNRSSGKMGFAIARLAALRGANVKLIAGPVELKTPFGVERIDVTSAAEMRAKVLEHASASNVVIMAAAVADFRPAAPSPTKIKKAKGPLPTVALAENPDILAEVGASFGPSKPGGPFLVGFALETGTDEEVIAYAQQKRERKNVHLVVANHAAEALGKDTNRIFLVDGSSVETLDPADKTTLADILLDRIRARL